MYPEPSRGTSEGSFLHAPASPEWHSHCWQYPWLHMCPDAQAGGGAALKKQALGRRLGEGTTADQCRSSEFLRVGQAGPCRVWLRGQLPTHFRGPSTQLVTGSLSGEAQRHLWSHLHADLSSLSSPFPPGPSFVFVLLLSPHLNLLQSRRLPVEWGEGYQGIRIPIIKTSQSF